MRKNGVYADRAACGEEEIRALPDPDFLGIEKLPIRPRVRTAPNIQRP